jgi:hypothetical protein
MRSGNPGPLCHIKATMFSSFRSRSLLVVSICSFAFGGIACVGGGDAPKDPYQSGSAGKGSTTDKDAGGDAGDALESFKPGAADSRFPLVAGATWTYRHTSLTKDAWNEVATMSDTTYEGEPAFVLEDEEDAEGAQTRSTFVVKGTGVWRAYREVHVNGDLALQVTYDPPFLRYDEAWTQVGQSQTLDDDWTQMCIMTSVASKCAPGAVQTGKTTHKYTVVDTHVNISVPAGDFDAIEIQRFNPDASETRRFWFAPGVGKVREEDTESGAVEELAEFVVPS